MPSFAEIKSQALKAKDSATDKFNSTKDRYQVSTPSPPPTLTFTTLKSNPRCRIGITIHKNPGRNLRRRHHRPCDLTIRRRALGDLNLDLLPLCEPHVQMRLRIHVHPLCRLYLQIPQPQDFLFPQRDDSTPLQNHLQSLNRMQTLSIG